MRIIGGERRGHRLAEWHGARIRPLRDRVRTALFDILGSQVQGAAFLDLFAGTGAVGLEALSRGARWAAFVDASARATRIIYKNARRLDYCHRCEVLQADAVEAVHRLAQRRSQFDLAFVGAPYGTGLAQRAAAALGEGGPLRVGATAVVEVFHKEEGAPRRGGLVLTSARDYGETRLLLYRFEGEPLGQ
ncbi:MAG: 16S rRNA (guanine(966)-N(2))-methyltransferase RsmD [Candidatus Bipolaricaulaceae bacterium]